MAKFEAGSARSWAMERLRGVSGCVMPSFTPDQTALNEEAIRHDIRRERELGFTGFLIVGECGTTAEEFERFVEIAVDEAGDDMVTIVQAAAGTLAQNVALTAMAAGKGVDLVMPSYPIGFYPQDPAEIVAYTRAVAQASGMGVIVFAMNLWNFTRLHPSGFAPAWLEEIVDTIPNVVAIKNEMGDPGVAGLAEVFRRFSDRVLVSDPLEMNAPAWASTFGMPWMGTSNYEYFGDVVPRIHALAQDKGTADEAMALYWSVHPARAASSGLMKESNAGTSFVHRLLWKYQGWLQGFNGGPVRSPHSRLHDRQMQHLRSAALASGMAVTDDADALFFTGRVAT
ncbi:dihydrodipicolinate synthase family protein [Streptomyces sp. NPDC056190]|uniref:dihydrodipicolinate synthase family protein n=1 Tax=Streptomyces sp. NPDC056190 TaxID=3345741 RepID=UPI0035DB3F50